jgi:hypothetical protein
MVDSIGKCSVTIITTLSLSTIWWGRIGREKVIAPIPWREKLFSAAVLLRLRSGQALLTLDGYPTSPGICAQNNGVLQKLQYYSY